MEPITSGPNIAATAIVHPRARVHPTAVIGAYCIVEDEVEIGPHTRLDPFATVKRYTTVGEGNHIYSGAQLGTDPMDKKFREENASYLRVGNRNVLRECINISRGTKPGAVTALGDDNYVMSCVHIAHDCQLGSHITIGPSTSLGGYAEIEDNAFLSAGVGVHQFSKVGRLVHGGGQHARGSGRTAVFPGFGLRRRGARVEPGGAAPQRRFARDGRGVETGVPSAVPFGATAQGGAGANRGPRNAGSAPPGRVHPFVEARHLPRSPLDDRGSGGLRQRGIAPVVDQ